MYAFHNDPKLKAWLIREIKKHQKADRYMQNHYFHSYGGPSSWKGCALGCAVQSINKKFDLHLDHDDHTAYETLGMPTLFAVLEDAVFEALPMKEAKEWPLQLANATPVGADLSRVFYQALYWICNNPAFGLRMFEDQSGIVQFNHILKRKIEEPDVVIEANEWQGVGLRNWSFDAEINVQLIASRMLNEEDWYYGAHYTLWDFIRNYPRYVEINAQRENRNVIARMMADEVLRLVANAPVVEPTGVTYDV